MLQLDIEVLRPPSRLSFLFSPTRNLRSRLVRLPPNIVSSIILFMGRVRVLLTCAHVRERLRCMIWWLFSSCTALAACKDDQRSRLPYERRA